MLTTACLTLTAATLALVAWCGYTVGRTRTVRESEGYIEARNSGYRAGLAHGERVRTVLRAERDELAADRDRLDVALDEMGERYDRLLAERFVPLATAAVAEVYDHEEAGL